MWSGASNLCAENGQEVCFRDLGDLGQFDQLNRDWNGPLLTLGGDHSISLPLIRAASQQFPNLTVVQFDAHPDLYPEFEGSRDSHACPFARMLEEGLANLIQLGIRTENPTQKAVAERYQVARALPRNLEGPLYLSVDLDVLDPAFAPGVSHHEPGGWSTRELLTVLQNLPRQVVGADLVEYNPVRDPVGITAAVGAKLVKELLALLIESRPSAPSTS